ncbi:MAG TPA: 3-phosphoshikimate 1-carboxyvinyltransferase [Streptosporangiaceae bacterium]|nr:3-phosphoshikimate 1-carboxyvinyltransferase [Streptosporangiaceae bacterium]
MHNASVRNQQAWRAPVAKQRVHTTVRLPGSKSITNRALILAALADAPTTITGPLRARDTDLMAGALRALGTSIEDVPEGWLVTPGPMDHGAQVNVGNAGTVMRFVPPVAPLVTGDVGFSGDPRASHRPVGQLIAALTSLGAVIDDGGRGAVPFTVHGTGQLGGGAVTLDASGSSQLVSGLLLAGCCYDKGLEVRHQGPPVPSAPHIAMTVSMLRDAGADVEESGQQGGGTGLRTARPDTWRVHPGPLRPGTVRVEPDLVNSAPFLAAALVTGGTVTIADWPATTTQPAGHIVDLLTRMGAACELTAEGMTVTGTGGIHGIVADLRDSVEVTPVLTALAALASSPSVFTGIAHMRTHETDRLAALATEINKLGGQVTELPGGLEIHPRPLTASGVLDSYDDHRMVMAAAVLGLAVPGLTVANPGTVAKTFPAFTSLWAEMLDA